MIRRSEQYNSDYMSREMDERLEQLEERLTALYANAALETQSDFYDFMEKYKKDYEVMLDKLNAEKITKAEFDLWCSKKILKTTQYKEMLATLTNILVNTDVAAMAIIKGKLPFVVAQSYNFAQSLGFAAADKAGLSIGTFQVYNAWSVQKIIKDNPRLLPKVDIPLDKQWNQDKINTAITHSIIHGDSIPKVAKRLREVTNMDKNSAIRNARTSMTGAENLGRNESIKFMKKNGVPVQLMWSATHDSRTRDTHLLLDRTFQNEKGYFGEGILSKLIKFPGDPEGLPQEIYNCRCRASIYLEGIDHSKDAELYDKFMTENYPEDYRQLKQWEEKTGRAEERRQTLEYQKVLKEIHKTGYYDPNSFAKNVEETKAKFIPATTKAKAEEYAKQFAKNVNYNGLSLENANKINETLANLTEKYPINKLDIIEQNGRAKEVMSANYHRLTLNNRLMGDALDKSYKNFLIRQETAKQTIENITSRYPKGKIPFALQNKITILKRETEYSRWCVADSYNDKVSTAVMHEYGHIIADQYFGQVNTNAVKNVTSYEAIREYKNTQHEWESIYKKATENGDVRNLSRYGASNSHEYFAECFCAREMGEELPDYVEDFMERKIDNGKPL